MKRKWITSVKLRRKHLSRKKKVRYILNLPHIKQKSTCYINGLYDILLWKGAFYEYFLLPTIGGMAGFAYLRIKKMWEWKAV